jgi:ribosomal-protein-alanine N-acetyltransferase
MVRRLAALCDALSLPPSPSSTARNDRFRREVSSHPRRSDADEGDIKKRILYQELMGRKDALDTERLELSTASWHDALFVFRLIGNETVRQYLGGAVTLRRRPSVIRSYLNVGPGEFMWTAKIRKSASRVGLISVTKHKDGQEFELSYQFHPNAWGRGYAFEAASATLRFVREKIGLQRLIAETQVANVASCRLLERLGMSERQRLLRYGQEQAIYMIDL